MTYRTQTALVTRAVRSYRATRVGCGQAAPMERKVRLRIMQIVSGLGVNGAVLQCWALARNPLRPKVQSFVPIAERSGRN